MQALALPLVLAVALVPAAPPLSAAAQGAASNQAGQEQAGQASAWVTVTSAADIVGRTLRDLQGNEAGRVAGLVLDLESGVVLYGVVGSAGSFEIGQDYVAVPFPAMKVDHGIASVTVGISAEKIAKAPRITEARLAELGQPDRVGSFYGYYAIPTPQGYVIPPSDDRARHPDRFVLVRPGQVFPPQAAQELASDVRGADVRTAGGSLVGEIERVMIDIGTMRVAYLLVSHGGFLGFDEKWLPVPLQALAWSPRERAYTLKANASALKQVQSLPKGETPTRVRREQLQALYRLFGLKSYQQQS
jgi:sporulation protein YlmC with PRC-barrel domain